jgi:putative ABC transport system permease protein
MFASLRQTWAVIQINLLSLPQRLWLSISGCVAIGLVVFVLLGALALNHGLQQTLDGSGADDVAIVLRDGADGEISSAVDRAAQIDVAGAPGVQWKDGKAVVSPELYLVVDALKQGSGLKANLALRGVTPQAWSVRPAMRLVQGRQPQAGTNEIVVGEAVQREFQGFGLGSTLQLRGVPWTVVGVFSAGGSVFESELWGDLHVVGQLMDMGDTVQSLRLRLNSAADVARLQAYLQGRPQLQVSARSEHQFYAEQSQRNVDLVSFIGKPLAAILALGALAGALNTMYGAVAERAREMATLRAIGYGRFPAFAGTVAESVLLALVGAAFGMLLAWLVFQHLSSSTLGASFSTVVFRLSLSGEQLMQGARWALAIGVLGGLFPAWSASRQPVAQGLAEPA